MNIEQLHALFLACHSACTDTRKLTQDDMFFALKGDNFNGNQFAEKAINSGAKYAIIDEANYKLNEQYIYVENVLKTLQSLSNYHRKYLGLKIIALTGSNGKTTTKELINAVLTQKFETVATQGNLNNHIGVPLTLLAMNQDTEVGIVEMGANHQKEIEFLCTIAEPNFGYITNFGKAHLEGFGGIEGVIKGKTELYSYLKQNNGLIFVNGHDQKQLELLEDYDITYGFGYKKGVSIQFIESNPMVKLTYNNRTINSNLIGRYNFANIAAAIMIGDYFQVESDQIKYAIESYIPDNNRSQIIKKGSNRIILDAYNANPTSMQAALENLSEQSASKTIAILGDMYELGDTEIKEHQAIVHAIANLNIDKIYFVGELFYEAKIDGENLYYFKAFERLVEHLQREKIERATCLIKASRGMALERVLEYL